MSRMRLLSKISHLNNEDRSDKRDVDWKASRPSPLFLFTKNRLDRSGVLRVLEFLKFLCSFEWYPAIMLMTSFVFDLSEE